MTWPPKRKRPTDQEGDTGLRLPTPLPPEHAGPSAQRPGGQPAPLAIALILALLTSIVLNGVLAVRLRERSDEVLTLNAQLQQEQERLSTLRHLLRSGAGGTPLQQVASAVERLRGLRFRQRVDPQLLSDAQLRRRIALEFRRDNPRREIDALDKLLALLGILDADDDLYEMLLQVQTEAIIGFYDTKSKELVMEARGARQPTPLDRFVLAHEYVHALTDQHFDLARLDRLVDARRDEEAAAFTALVEGDASHIMALYEEQVLTDEERRRLDEERAGIPTEVLEATPRAIQEILLFPYVAGVQFVRELVRRGEGLELVNAAYKDPPVSTEQILHPAKYLDRRDDPTRVVMPDLARAMGAGWRRLDDGDVGELDLRVLLDQFLAAPEAGQAAAGWDGGRFAVLESRAGVLAAFLTVWDSEAEAREVAEAFSRWLPLRYGNTGTDFRLTGGAGRGWHSDEGAGAVLRDRNRMLFLIGPDEASMHRARRAFDGF